MKNSLIKGLSSRSLLAATLAAMAFSAMAQQPGKTIVAESVQPFSAFAQWVSTVVTARPEVNLSRVESLPLALTGAATTTPYQPLPVILGLPEFPLLGNGAAQVSHNWSTALNYQGIYMQQVVLNATGTNRDLRSMATPLHFGERFKIRVTSTFDAVAEVDQILGDAWYGKRTGQIYPQVGLSVQLKAGETVDIPIEPNTTF